MRKGTLMLGAAVLGLLLVSPAGFAQQNGNGKGKGNGNGNGNGNFVCEPPKHPYDPYPRGILPRDLEPELDRVRREVRFIFDQALTEWRALPPLTRTSNPPTIHGSGYAAVRTLGKLIYFDENMSPFRNVACSSCHMPYAAFSGPIPSVNLTMIAYPGSFRFRAGKRTPQRYTYSARFPVLQYNETQQLFFGGNFWDGRSTGPAWPTAHPVKTPRSRSFRSRWPRAWNTIM